ncbi:MAG: 50S ribosomal protein L11 methyltransferase [Bacteroidetes bacterium]|nr:50S ribosomal protein L11 methyltransferase [Bacteroidota bacterium]
MKYIELSVDLKEVDPWRDILVAELAETGFESFVETNSGFLGYIQESLYQKAMLETLTQNENVAACSIKTIEEQNWNAEWEKNFDPVFVENKLAIIAPFHERPSGFEQVITIMPKMSFGTGHHQTTWLVSQALFELRLTGKNILDMGTGTGILAILAEKLGAASVFAPDIDEWSYLNALENCETNNCKNITVVQGGDEVLPGKIFHIILANINKNVLIKHFSVYSSSLHSGGLLLISGFFETDQADLVREAASHGLVFDKINTREGWAIIHLRKP